MNIELFLPWIGHASFALSAVSFLMSSILWLRVFAILSGLLGLAYNSSIAIGLLGPATPELWNVVGWLGLFFAINVAQSIRLLVRNSEVRLSESERALMAKSWPLMRSRDFQRILQCGTRRTLKHGEVLVQRYSKLNDLYLVVEGKLLSTRVDGNSDDILPGQFVGEISFGINEQYGGSAHDIVASGDTVIIEWPYSILKKVSNDPVMQSAILDGFFRGLVKKNQLLLVDSRDAGGHRKEVVLSQDQKLVNATAFPGLCSEQVYRLLQLADTELLESGQSVETSGRIGVITKGACRIHRDDGCHVDIGSGNMLGEVGFVANCEDKARARVSTLRPTQVLWWRRTDIDMLRVGDPPLYAALMLEIARDMAKKLTTPLSKGNVFTFPCRYSGREDFSNCNTKGLSQCSK